MSELSKKISYLKGLSEGMKLAEKSDEGSIINKLIDALSDAADEIEKLSERCEANGDAIMYLEEDVDGINSCIDDIYDQIEDETGFEDYDDDDDDLFDLYDDDDDGLYEITCSECGEDVLVDFDMLDDDNHIICPNCHKSIALEFDIDDDDEDDEDIDD